MYYQSTTHCNLNLDWAKVINAKQIHLYPARLSPLAIKQRMVKILIHKNFGLNKEGGSGGKQPIR